MNDAPIRDHLVSQLTWRSAHATFDDVVQGIPPTYYGQQPDGVPYSLWQLLEHMRLTQRDILDFCRDPDYVEPSWPDDYWPDAQEPPEAYAWSQSIVQFRNDLEAMKNLITNPDIDLIGQIPHGDGQTYLREALLLADHNAYHLGQMVVVRRLLGIWT